jgi:hypothetical protein
VGDVGRHFGEADVGRDQLDREPSIGSTVTIVNTYPPAAAVYVL